MDTSSNDHEFPSQPCLPSGQNAPLPHLSRVAFFRSSRKAQYSPPPPRPVPPTPHRMEIQLLEEITMDASSHRKRYSVASAIPEPLSGSSRNATPSRINSVTSAPECPTEPASDHHDSTQSHNDKPSLSSNMPKSRLPRSESLLPYWQRPQQDLSGVKQQLQLRYYSTHSVSSPSKIGIPRDISLTGSSLPQSRTSASLLSSSKNVTPGSRLLKPLSPPLLKSRTFNNLLCTNLPPATPFPTTSLPTRLPRSVGSKQSQVNVVDALRESRMTDEEIMHLNQIRMEAAKNQDRMNHTFEIRQHEHRIPSAYISPTSSSFIRTPEEATINLSANDVVNTERLEQQRRKSTSGRPLFINSALANTYTSEPNASTQGTTIKVDSCKLEEEWDTNLALVFFEAGPAYWTGRYLSICDRLRTENMRAATASSPASTSSFESTCSFFDSADAQRMETALAELRACCQTEQAVKSFEAFETQLRKSTNSRAPLWPTRLRKSEPVDGDADRILKASMKTQEALQSRLTPVTVTRGSRVPTQVKADHPLPTIFSRLNLTKSKTTGNLATLSTFDIPSLSTSKFSSPSTPHSSAAKVPETMNHSRRKSEFQITQKAREEALREREERAKQRAADAQRRLGERTSSYGSMTSSTTFADNGSKVTRKSQLHHAGASLPSLLPMHRLHHQSCPANLADDDINYRAIKSGHPPPPTRPRSPWHAQVKMVGDEKVIKSRRKSDRQSSGEIVKGFLDAGMIQVKKIKRRVGGSMSWVDSAEDLSSGMSGSESGRGK